ncbi:MAG: fibronectin type III domain-containing protein [Eubacterium sp.]|nr:fibronectin type III domain-containing protein [Eubacterium sp.]
MKKVLSLSLALVMLCSCFGTLTVQAETEGVLKLSDQITNAAKYIANNSNMNSLSYGDYWLMTDAGYDMSQYNAEYLENLKANLTKNNGKIVIEGTEWYQDENEQWQSYSYSYEDIGVYGAVILTLKHMSLDPASFEGFDITAAFKNFDLSTVSNPYSYRLAIWAAAEDEFAKTLADDMITRFYTKGSGMNYYGYSCDNTCHFLAALYPTVITGLYDEFIDDACGVLKTYKKENGAYADSVYVTTVNADSTALSMLGYSSALDAENAYWYYQKLIDNFYNPTTGAFTTNGEDNLYATKDALLSLIQFNRIVNKVHITTEVWQVSKAASFNHNGVYLSKCPICNRISTEYVPAIDSITLSQTEYTYDGKAKTPAVTVRDVKGNLISDKYYTVKYSDNENVGTATATVTFDGLYTGTAKRKFVVKPKSLANATVIGVNAMVYTGIARTPTITVKLGDTTLKKNVDYKVTYTNNVNVGTAYVTITGINNYSGKINKPFVIGPKAVKITKLSAKGKTITAKWQMQTAQTTGYQLQYSTSAKFISAKTVTVKGNKTTSKKIAKLTSKKKYFVRVRTYKVVNKKNYYSDWSKAKSIVTK